MAVDVHPSRRPSPPRKPPAVEPGRGESGQPGVPYGAHQTLKVKSPNASEMSHHFTGSDGHAKKAGREEPQEGSTSRASKPGDEDMR